MSDHLDRTSDGIIRKCCECSRPFKGEGWQDYCAECHAVQEANSPLKMNVPRAKPHQPYNPNKPHDRRSNDLLRNAEVAAIEVDCPIEKNGATLVVMRSIRNDPLAALHSRRQIDEAQYQGGRAFQHDFETAERGPQAIDPSKEHVDGGRAPEAISEAMRKAVIRLNRVQGVLGQSGAAIVHDVLIANMTLDLVAGKREMNSELERKYIGRRLRECLDDLALIYGFGGEGREVLDTNWKPAIYVPDIGFVYLTEEDVRQMLEQNAKNLTVPANRGTSGLIR